MWQYTDTASALPIYDILDLQKVSLVKISDDVIACDLWFAPPPNLIKNSGYAYVLIVLISSTKTDFEQYLFEGVGGF